MLLLFHKYFHHMELHLDKELIFHHEAGAAKVRELLKLPEPDVAAIARGVFYHGLVTNVGVDLFPSEYMVESVSGHRYRVWQIGLRVMY